MNTGNRTFDPTGLVTQVEDLGDVAVNDDEQCTRTTYGAFALPRRIHMVGVACSVTPSYPDDEVSDVLTTYDGSGNPTKI